jgi:serine/threonine protein kinase
LHHRKLVIGDFGHAKDLNQNLNSRQSSQAFGTDNYLAPEANDRSKRTTKMDIWSFGCIIYELFELETLFNDQNYDKLRDSIREFNVQEDLKIRGRKIKDKPFYKKVLEK